MNRNTTARITLLASATRPDPIAVHEVRDLEHLAEILNEPLCHADKHAAPLWLPGVLKRGGRRCNADVEALYFFVADLDDWTDTALDRLTRRLEMLDVGHIFHPTHSHAAAQMRGLHRLRLICPLAVPVTRLQWTRVWQQASALLGGGFDASCKDVARAYWPLVHPPGAEKHAWVRHTPGGVLP